MKPHLPLRLLFALACGACVSSSGAADIIKNNLSDSLNMPSSWNGNTVPGASDIAVWDTSSAPGTVATPLSLGGDLAWGGIRLAADTPLNVALGAPDDTTSTLSLGASGIKFKSANAIHQLDIYGNVELTTAQSWGNSDGTAWRNGPTVNVHGNLTGSGDLTFTSAHGIKASFQGDVSGYTGNINMNQWNNLSFARGLTGGNITANTYGGQSTILVEDGADVTYTHTLTLSSGVKAADNGPNRFTLATGTLTLAGTTSITNDVISVGAGANLNISGTTTANGTTFTLGDGASLRFDASSGSKTTFSNATTFSGGGAVTVIGAHDVATANGAITVGSGTTLDLTQGRLVFTAYTKREQAFVIQGTLKLTNFAYDGSIGNLADYSMTRYLDGGSILVEGTTHASGQGFSVTDRGGSFLVTQSGTTLTLSGNDHDGTIVFKGSNGALTMGGTGNIVLGGGNNQNALSGTGTLVKTGSGSLTINHQSASFSGSVILQDGTLTIAHNEAAGTGTSTIVYEGGVLDLGGHVLSNVAISFKNGKTATDVLNGSAFLGSINIGNIGAYDLSSSMTFGSGYVAEADTVFTLAEDINLGHKADGIRSYLNAKTHALTLTGDGRNFTIDNYDAADSLLYGESVSLENIGNITLQNNASSSSEHGRGGAVTANGSLAFQSTGNITMQHNTAGESGGAITGYGGALSAGTGITFDTTGDLNFTGNSAARNGGAIYDLFGDIMMTNVGNVTFADNQAGTAGDVNDGGAVYEGSGSVTIDTASSLTMTNNKALGGSGGAIFSATDIAASNTGDVHVTGNTATQSGGAWHTDSGNVTLTQAGTVSFQDNEAGTRGGAISSGNSVSLTDMTGSLTFANNAALNTSESSDSGNGGAIYAYNDVTISGIEGGVSFTGNHAAMYGGAISAYNVTLIADRGSIVFNGNTQLGGTTLNAVDSRLPGIWSFDAAAGQEIAFYDPVTSGSDAAVTVLLNGQAGSTGIIRFSGEKVAEHAAANASLDADASRYSDVYADTTLSGGTLILEHGVTYGHVSSDWSNEYPDTSFTGEGGKVALDKTSTLSAKTITMNSTQLDATKGGNLAAESVSFAAATVTIGDVLTVQAAQGLSFGSGVTLHATTPDAALSGSFAITDGIAFALTQENFQTLALTGSTLTINGGQLILNDRDVNYTLDFWQTEQEFVLLAADNTSTINGDFTGIISATTGSSVVFSETPVLPTGQWDYRWDNGSQLVAHWTPGIPEPGSATLLLAAFGASLMRRRRTRAERA